MTPSATTRLDQSVPFRTSGRAAVQVLLSGRMSRADIDQAAARLVVGLLRRSRLGTWDSPGDRALRALTATVAVREAADARVAALVTEARDGGASWAVIAVVLGVSRQAAHQHYAAVKGS